MNEKLKKDVENLKSNVDAFQKDLTDSLADKKEMTEDKVSQLSEKVTNAINAFKDDAGKKLGEINKIVKKKGKEAIDSSRDVISNKPMTAVAIAFGAGLLTALLLCRRKK
jgi:ElaB/YqjD/DUF883 family membrane-anchored ribosome-binding protein